MITTEEYVERLDSALMNVANDIGSMREQFVALIDASADLVSDYRRNH